tara:strand:+ start:235 stop:600 length:366 start_codon:yes stop_codon:yes gene_type:complete
MNKTAKLLQWTYLILALLGAILPTLANIHFVIEYGPGFDLVRFIELANVNSASQSLSRDLFVASTAIFIWIISESKRLKMKNLWIVIVGTFTIAFAFSAPLFLYLRERRLAEINNEKLETS